MYEIIKSKVLIIGFVHLFLILMSPAALDSFSKITGLNITAGVIDLLEDHQEITATGHRDGVSWEVRCRWQGGVPQVIILENPQVII